MVVRSSLVPDVIKIGRADPSYVIDWTQQF
jgi:hypothetical protein